MTAQTQMELPARLAWLNVPPTTLREQHGRIVALVFINGASIWCAQRLAELVHWQARNPGYLQILVMLVPRFDSERDPKAALKQFRRMGIAAPVALDADWSAWQQFGIESWPTVLLIDTLGNERERIVGLGGDLDKSLAALCADLPLPHDDDLRVFSEKDPEPRLPLRFPSGLAANADRLYVADSGHHRILECTHAGRILREFGMNTSGFMDGMLTESAFSRPQGLALLRESLYVADTGNHALRRINLNTGKVDTLCGNGQSGKMIEGADTHLSLNHPQALAVTQNQLFIAMAGDNTIWSYDLGRAELKWCAGAGLLDVRDGNGYMAAFAQPVSLAIVEQVLYVCDALGSAVRSLQVRSDLVQTLVGQGVWEYGDADGPRQLAQLQNPQAIALAEDASVLWIADSGNGRLRQLRLGGRELTTVELPRRLQGSTGIVAAAGMVWIAETDAHAVLRYDPASGELSDVAIDE